MELHEIIREMSEQHFVSRLIKKISPDIPQDWVDDLTGMIYEDLLMKDPSFVIGMWERNELKFYVIRMIQQSIFSGTSNFHRQIRMFLQKSKNIDGYDFEA